MPLTRCPDDVSIEILKIAELPLSAVSKVMLVQRAWNAFIHTYEEHIYHNLAICNGLTSARTTSLKEEKLAFGSNIAIESWKAFCQWRIAVERNWAGLGPSSIARIFATGNQVFCRKEIPAADRVIVSSTTGGISVYDGTRVVWALPTGYVEKPINFAYGNGYLIFQRAREKTIDYDSVIEIWQDERLPKGLISAAFPPTPEQETATTSIAAQFPSVHFRPTAAIPAPSARTEAIRLHYPTLVVATSSAVYTWDLEMGDLTQTLCTQRSLMRPVLGVEVSQELIVVFDREQVRFFSRSHGLFLFLLPSVIPELGGVPRGVQLRPPTIGGTPSQSSDAILLQQVLFRKRSKWSASRGDITAVGISECGNTLVVLSSKRRMFIVNNINRVIVDDLPVFSAAVDVKIGVHYGEIMFLTVTRDKIALGTTTGILILNLRPCAPQGAASPRPYGTVRFCRSGLSNLSTGIQLRASVVWFKPRSTDRINVLEFSGTKLLFHRDPTTVVYIPGLSDESIEKVNDRDRASNASDDSMPRLQSISDISNSSGEDADESDYGDDEEDPRWDFDVKGKGKAPAGHSSDSETDDEDQDAQKIPQYTYESDHDDDNQDSEAGSDAYSDSNSSNQIPEYEAVHDDLEQVFPRGDHNQDGTSSTLLLNPIFITAVASIVARSFQTVTGPAPAASGSPPAAPGPAPPAFPGPPPGLLADLINAREEIKSRRLQLSQDKYCMFAIYVAPKEGSETTAD